MLMFVDTIFFYYYNSSLFFSTRGHYLCVIFIHFSLSEGFFGSFQNFFSEFFSRILRILMVSTQYNTIAFSIITTCNSFSTCNMIKWLLCLSIAVVGQNGKMMLGKKPSSMFGILNIFITHTHAHTYSQPYRIIFWGGCRIRVKTTVCTIPANIFVQIVSYLVLPTQNVFLIYTTVKYRENNEKNSHTHRHILCTHAHINTLAPIVRILGFEEIGFHFTL